MRRIVSLWLPDLPTDRLERDDPGLAARPLVAILDQAGRPLLTGVNAAAATCGLSPGMALANARALVPGLVVRPGDPRADRALLQRLARWAGRYSPLVAMDGPDGLLIDVAGCAHLFDGERALLEDMSDRLDRFGIGHRAALADTRLAARAAARFDAVGPIAPIYPPGGQKAGLAPLPVRALGVDPALTADLARVGLKRIGDLAALPRSSLARRYGLGLCAALDRAFGEAPDPIDPMPPPAPYRVRLQFPDAIGTPDDIARALDRLLRRMADRLERENKGVRQLTLEAFRVDGDVHRLTIGTARASREPAHLARLFGEKLGSIDPGFGIETMVLSAPVTEASLPVQQVAAIDGRKPENAEDLSNLIDRLSARLGAERVLHIRPVASHLPDRAAVFSRARESRVKPGEWRDRQQTEPRPLRLLDRPEPVTPLACPPPGRVLGGFRWRGRRHAVTRAIGPERISPEWWCVKPSGDAWTGPRDYYAVEEAAGVRLWLFCEGQTARGSPLTAPRWFVHGVF